MHEQPVNLTSQDQHRINGTLFVPDQVDAALVISHGMAEHAGRYADFARWLAGHNIATLTYHHRGHGPHCSATELGHYSDCFGWSKVTDDLYRALSHTRTRFPGVPLLLLGHSMGSFIAQSCIQRHGEAVDGLILSATNRIHRAQLHLSKLIISLLRARYGQRHRSRIIARMTFDKFNRLFEPIRTSCDWLSRDSDQVDRYLADPLCGFDCTVGLWHDFVQGMLGINPARWRRDLPVHLLAGTEDAVGEMGRGITRHFQAIRDANVQRVTLRLFDGGRHEMLNETNAEEVRAYIHSLCPHQRTR